MPTKEIYEKYEAKQTLDKKPVESSIGGSFKGEHWSQQYSKELTFEHPSQEQINEMAHHKAITCYDRLPDKDKDKPGVHSYEPNVSYLDMVGATQRPGDRKYGEQED